MFTIVAGIDTDAERALTVADEICGLPGSELRVVLVHAFGENPEGASIEQMGAARKARDRLERHDIDVVFEERSGDPATGIQRVAEEYDAEMICVAGRKRSPAGKAVFGSVTQDVILGTDRAVLVCSSEGETIDG